MEPQVLHVTEADMVRDIGALLDRVQAGAEVVIERNDRPVAVIRAASPIHHTIAECIALAKAHEEETGQSPLLDPDYAADVEEIIRNRKPRILREWD